MEPSADPLSKEQVAQFQRDGFLLLRGFYDVERDVEPIRRAIHDILGLLLDKYEIPLDRPAYSPENFDAGFAELVAADRRYGGEIYDAIKQIPAFIRLIASERHERVFAQLRGSTCVGIAGQGHGIRIDIPGESRFLAPWHQEYPSQCRSVDGINVWTPLQPMTEELGPVRVCPGSHREGLLKVRLDDPDHADQRGAYALRIVREKEILERYPVLAPLTDPGDALLVDFLVMHASSINRTPRTRWSMQMRYFNFREPTGIDIGWRGSFATGETIATIHPELVVDS